MFVLTLNLKLGVYSSLKYNIHFFQRIDDKVIKIGSNTIYDK